MANREAGDTFVELLHAETVRRLTLQLQNLSGMRTRAGALFSAAAVATSLLAGLAANARMQGHPLVLGLAGWIAIICFGVATVISLAMFRNMPQLRFTLPRTIEKVDETEAEDPVLGVEDWLDRPQQHPAKKADAYKEIATQLERLYRSNAQTMKKLFVAMEFLTLAVALELFAWIWVLMQ